MPMQTPSYNRELDALTAFAKAAYPEQCHRGAVDLHGTPTPYLDIDNSRLIFGYTESDLDTLTAALHSLPQERYAGGGISSVTFVAEGMQSSRPQTLGLGVRLAALPTVLAELLSLPHSWRDDQKIIIRRILAPLDDTGSQPVVMRGRLDRTNVNNALLSLRGLLNENAQPDKAELVFVQAEAGKGKSTLLALIAKEWSAPGGIPIPLLIPLRELVSGRGVSWEEVLRTVGIGPGNATTVAHAVRHGLVLPIFDGLDEVAGRYDPQLVRELLALISAQFGQHNARVVLSGRMTEATQVDSEHWRVLELELPASSSTAFRDYVRSATRTTADSWPEIVVELPKELWRLLGINDIADEPFGETSLDTICEWIAEVFEDFGKDRSLFFVQSLAATARNRQLAGYPRLLSRGQGSQEKPPWRPSTLAICILAATMACIREQGKIEPLARKHYTAEQQIHLLTGLALYASVDPFKKLRLPTPNELARQAFEIDPVNANEQWTAVIRQSYKHALLYSRNTSLVAGDWIPSFLSAWVRCALVAWAWLHPEIVSGLKRDDIRRLVSCSQAKLAFTEIFPSLLEQEDGGNRNSGLAIITELASELANQSTQGLTEPAVNLWLLWAALPVEVRELISVPTTVPEGADLMEVEFVGLEFDSRFGGSTFFLNGSTFEDCVFKGVSFQGVDLTGVAFRRCAFMDVVFGHCDGPLVFEECRMVDFRICNIKNTSGRHPALTFLECHFGKELNFTQDVSLSPSGQLAPIAEFQSCTSEMELDDQVFHGEWIGFARRQPKGVSIERPETSNPLEACLRSMLRPFFPRRAGESEQIQARRYIRLSALGRGMFPDGTPPAGDLRRVLESEGFNTGGRTEHLYAPWASANGAPQSAIDFRNELLAFVRDGKQGERVISMLKNLKRFW